MEGAISAVKMQGRNVIVRRLCGMCARPGPRVAMEYFESAAAAAGWIDFTQCSRVSLANHRNSHRCATSWRAIRSPHGSRESERDGMPGSRSFGEPTLRGGPGLAGPRASTRPMPAPLFVLAIVANCAGRSILFAAAYSLPARERSCILSAGVETNQEQRSEATVTFDVSPVPLEEILPLWELTAAKWTARSSMTRCPAGGSATCFFFGADDRIAGYGFVMGYQGEPKDMIREFYVLPPYRGLALPMFRRLIEVSKRRITVQSNDVLLTLLLYDFAGRDHQRDGRLPRRNDDEPDHPRPTFRPVTDADRERIFEHKVEGVGDWLIEDAGALVATGGIATHYNPPYGDLFMEVDERFRRRGCGSYLIQELKRTCYETGRIPAARCDISNLASRATLQKAGLLPCARLLSGVLSTEPGPAKASHVLRTT